MIFNAVTVHVRKRHGCEALDTITETLMITGSRMRIDVRLGYAYDQ
jgi:hypothetical protein